MSNIQHLLQAYRQSTQAVQLAKALATPQARIQLTGLIGSQTAFALAAAATTKASPFHLYIANSKEEAAYLQNDLQGILAEQTIHFFPDSFKRPSFFEEINSTQVLQRSETVNKITAPAQAPPSPPVKGGDGTHSAANHQATSDILLPSTGGQGGAVTHSANEKHKIQATSDVLPPSTGGQGGAVVITYPEALFEKVVAPEVLNRSRIDVAKGEKLDTDFMIQVLVEYGFERADFVYEPGQFSIRGGIIDLFSYGNDLPYRIELFDDEVETIRIFDPLTQLSKQNIARVSIVPNLNTRFRNDQKVSFFQVLPADTVLWIKDFQFFLDRLQYCFERAETFASKLSALDSAELREIFRDRAFLYPGDVVEDVQEQRLVFTEKQGAGVWGML